jgi:hypothetical protein
MMMRNTTKEVRVNNTKKRKEHDPRSRGGEQELKGGVD